ncbi:MAG: hypothetical protein HZA09_06985 [Nitrospirae bacterium]|nr:hypothetical protein [Nitrospirota bacterium]
MDNVSNITYYTMLFIGMLAVLFIVGRYVQKIPPAMVKKLNRISFVVALISGVFAAATQKPIFMYLLFASIICFFIFFNYKEDS